MSRPDSRNFFSYATHPALLCVLVIRIVQALTLPWFPISGYLVAQFIDIADYHVMRYFTGMKPEIYQVWDKVMDSALSIMMASIGWSQTSLGNWFLLALLYRGIGQTLFIITKQRWLIVCFPNIVEVLYLWKIVLPLISPSWNQAETSQLILIILSGLKLGQEALLHLWWEKHWTPIFTQRRRNWGLPY